MGSTRHKYKHRGSTTSVAAAPESEQTTRITHVKELALEECVRNFFQLHQNIKEISLFSQDSFFEPYLSRLEDMARFIKSQTNICLDTALPDITRIIARILQFGERYEVLDQMLSGCNWNPLIPRALETLLGESSLTDNYIYISQKLS